jgi:hypothetical protein
MEVWRNNAARSRNYCCRGKSIRTIRVCLLALVIRHTHHISSEQNHILVCGLSASYNIFPHHLLNDTIWRKKYIYILNIKCVFWFYLQLLSETFLILRRIQRDIINVQYVGVHIKYLLFLSGLNQTPISWKFFRKFVKFYENTSSGSRIVLCWLTDGLRNGGTDK